MNRNETYTPKIIDEQRTQAYAEFMLEVERCPTCGKWMLDGDARRLAAVFPKYYVQKLDRQLAAANMVLMSAAQNGDNNYICVECAEKGLASFVCCLCKQRRPTSELHDSFGDPPDHLCTVCYATVPAKQWNEKRDALNEAHKYDFS